jgi:hypothetical protein
MKNAITPTKLIIQDLTPCILSDGVARDIELLKNVPIVLSFEKADETVRDY